MDSECLTILTPLIDVNKGQWSFNSASEDFCSLFNRTADTRHNIFGDIVVKWTLISLIRSLELINTFFSETEIVSWGQSTRYTYPKARDLVVSVTLLGSDGSLTQFVGLSTFENL